MNFGGFNPGAIWTQTTRTLTSFGSTALIPFAFNHQALANATNVDLRPASGRAREGTLIGEAAVNVTWVPDLYDGTTFRAGVAGASGAAITLTLKGNFTMGPALSNTGTVSGNFDYAGYDLVQ